MFGKGLYLASMATKSAGCTSTFYRRIGSALTLGIFLPDCYHGISNNEGAQASPPLASPKS